MRPLSCWNVTLCWRTNGATAGRKMASMNIKGVLCQYNMPAHTINPPPPNRSRSSTQLSGNALPKRLYTRWRPSSLYSKHLGFTGKHDSSPLRKGKQVQLVFREPSHSHSLLHSALVGAIKSLVNGTAFGLSYAMSLKYYGFSSFRIYICWTPVVGQVTLPKH